MNAVPATQVSYYQPLKEEHVNVNGNMKITNALRFIMRGAANHLDSLSKMSDATIAESLTQMPADVVTFIIDAGIARIKLNRDSFAASSKDQLDNLDLLLSDAAIERAVIIDGAERPADPAPQPTVAEQAGAQAGNQADGASA